MNVWMDTLIVLVVLTNLKLLGSSRLVPCIRIVAVQGVAMGLLPFFAGQETITARMVTVATVSIALKGFAFPWLLLRALRGADVRREVEPLVSYGMSLLFGVAALAAALWMGSRLPLPGEHISSLLVPAALFTMMVGLFLIVSRKKALTQVLGYLALENGIYAIGMVLAQEQPLLIEMGILLDVFVAVFVMGITLFRISREFDNIDTDQMAVLKD
jgi:hydrogenase-4 component E